MTLAPLVFAFALGQASQPQVTLEELDKLVMLYKSYGLPLPPESAAFAQVGQVRSWEEKQERTLYEYGYLLEPGDARKPSRVLVGTRERQASNVKAVVPTAAVVAQAWLYVGHRPVFDQEAGLWLAIVERTRRHDDFALAMFERTLREGKSKRPLPQRIGLLARAHWMHEIRRKDSDRSAIAQRLRALLAVDKTPEDKYTEYVLERLDLTIKGRYQGPDRIETLIDALCDEDVVMSEFPSPSMVNEKYPSDRVMAIVAEGFEAVPALVKHLDDRRLTRSIFGGFNNFQPYHLTVGDLCRDILDGYRDKDDMYPFRTVKMNDVLNWWALAKRLGERAYLAQRVSWKTKESPWRDNLLIKMAKIRHPDLLKPPKK